MKLMRTSSNIMKSEKNTDIIVVPVRTAAPIEPKINISEMSTNTIRCPPNILAKRRIIRATGFVSAPKISITGINGTGHFIHIGTSGQKRSFQ